MNNKNKIVITKHDVIPYIYFVCSLAQRGRMYGGLSGKSDYIGGIFDRWINIIPESVIFNKYFLPKISDKLEVISDYYAYDPKKSGIAPDVLGVKLGTKAIPFVEYVDEWRAIDNAPQIEIKSFKKEQYMVSLRNQSYDQKYLVMVETSLDCDYLLPFFESSVIADDVYKRLEMDDSIFIQKKNGNNNPTSVTKIDRQGTNLGSLRLITVCLAADFMEHSTECNGGENPFYIKEIKKTKSKHPTPNSVPFSAWLTKRTSNLFSWNENKLDNKTTSKLLDISVVNIENIHVLKNSKSSITICTTGTAKINETELGANETYIIKFQLLDRSNSKSSEYFMHKSIIGEIRSKENAMIDNIRQFIK